MDREVGTTLANMLEEKAYIIEAENNLKKELLATRTDWSPEELEKVEADTQAEILRICNRLYEVMAKGVSDNPDIQKDFLTSLTLDLGFEESEKTIMIEHIYNFMQAKKDEEAKKAEDSTK